MAREITPEIISDLLKKGETVATEIIYQDGHIYTDDSETKADTGTALKFPEDTQSSVLTVMDNTVSLSMPQGEIDPDLSQTEAVVKELVKKTGLLGVTVVRIPRE